MILYLNIIFSKFNENYHLIKYIIKYKDKCKQNRNIQIKLNIKTKILKPKESTKNANP